jgi:hypothetical protein
VEARSTLQRAAEFLEREGLRGKRSGMFAKVTVDQTSANAAKEAAPEPSSPPKK